MTALGDAAPLGSAPVAMRSDPVIAMAGTPSGRGYWVATAAGRVFAFGDAGAPGSAPLDPGEPVVAMTASPSGAGFWPVTAGVEVYARAGAASFGNGLPAPGATYGPG